MKLDENDITNTSIKTNDKWQQKIGSIVPSSINYYKSGSGLSSEKNKCQLSTP